MPTHTVVPCSRSTPPSVFAHVTKSFSLGLARPGRMTMPAADQVDPWRVLFCLELVELGAEHDPVVSATRTARAASGCDSHSVPARPLPTKRATSFKRADARVVHGMVKSSTCGFGRRWGLGLTEDGWKIFHEHESVPFRMDGSARAAIELTP